MLSSPNSSLKILIVKDEPLVLKMLEGKLQREGYSVVTCLSVDDALQEISVNHFDAVITGIVFCDIVSLDIVAKVKSVNVAVPVMILSEMKQRNQIMEAFDSGADDFITNLNELPLRLKWILKKRFEENNVFS
jgi:DNA-binding response OmpR family regulator